METTNKLFNRLEIISTADVMKLQKQFKSLMNILTRYAALNARITKRNKPLSDEATRVYLRFQHRVYREIVDIMLELKRVSKFQTREESIEDECKYFMELDLDKWTESRHFGACELANDMKGSLDRFQKKYEELTYKMLEGMHAMWERAFYTGEFLDDGE